MCIKCVMSIWRLDLQYISSSSLLYLKHRCCLSAHLPEPAFIFYNFLAVKCPLILYSKSYLMLFQVSSFVINTLDQTASSGLKSPF